MRRVPICPMSLILTVLTLWILTCLPSLSQEAQDSGFFPQENFVQINPTLPNSKLNFEDDSQESCCAKDYTPSGKVIFGVTGSTQSTNTSVNVAKSEFEKSNPRYLENSTPAHLVSCERFAQLPELASNTRPAASMNSRDRNTLPIESYSTNVSLRPGAQFFTDTKMAITSDFHIETVGGDGELQLQGVNNYSVCMARGNNVAMISNTDSGSVLTYNGSDHIYLAGNNTNMLTRTGAGEDLIELYQARPNENSASETWTAYNIYKTAISGGSDTDTLQIKGTPIGTKWCHIGGYRIHGEYFHVVEFALPPTVMEGPRRQRINIGESIEFIMIKGKRYQLNDFLVHGMPVDTVARSVPIGDPLPRVVIH